MLHPNQFEINQAWIWFKLNKEPIRTEQDGDFHFLALMDAASCFILSSAPVPVDQAEPSQLEAKRLLKEAHDHKRRWPKTLLLPKDLVAQSVASEAERLGIETVQVAEHELLPIISEAQEGFRERFG